MKNFGSLMLAAIVGSMLTIFSFQWFGKSSQGVTIEHVNGAPAYSVGYKLNEKGEAVPLDFTSLSEKVIPAVVHIRSIQDEPVVSRDSRDPLRDFFFGPSPYDRGGPSQSSGSGVIINESGYIVTNNHVVQGADKVEVTLSDNRSFKAEVIGTDTDTDLAVIKIDQKGLPFLSFVNSDESKIGEWVLAVGNPFNLNSTVTAGIISAKGRNIDLIRSRKPQVGPDGQYLNTAIESFIQTDAAINPGNSGGALVNLSGGLLGINTAIASQTGTYMGYAFAVPSNIVSKVVEDLIGFGTVQRGWLGVTVQNVTNELAQAEDLRVREGAFIGGFAEKSSAKEAGLQEGDVVVKLDETVIKSSTALIEFVGRKRPGDKVNVTVNRKGKSVVIPVVLKNREGKVGAVKREERDGVESLGIELEDVDSKTLKKLDIENGVRVKELEEGKISRYTDMQKGFVITRVDDAPVKTAKEITDILKKKKPGDLVTFSGIYEDYPREYIYAIRM